jgi:glycolate oxidase
VITADIDQAAAAHGLMYAPDPASHRESTIGGNIATNAQWQALVSPPFALR